MWVAAADWGEDEEEKQWTEEMDVKKEGAIKVEEEEEQERKRRRRRGRRGGDGEE